MGTGVATLIGQKSAINATQATGSKQPTMEAGGASNGRDQLHFAKASNQWLATPSSFTVAKTERWGVLLIGKFHTAVVSGTQEIAMVLRNDANGNLVMVTRGLTTTLIQARMFYDDGGAGVAENIQLSATDILTARAFGSFLSSPHKGYLNGTTTDGAETAGASARADTTDEMIVFGAGDVAASPAVPANVDLWCAAVFEMSGTDAPSGLAAMIALARTYYDEAGL